MAEQFTNKVRYKNIDPVFFHFPMDKWKEDSKFFHNFIGGKVRKEYFRKLKEGERKDKPAWNATLETNKSPEYACSEDYYEWRDLLTSIKDSKGTFNFLKLGAHTGRWEAFAAIANHYYRGNPCHLISVEYHRLGWIRDTMEVNGISHFKEVEHEIVGSLVKEEDGKKSVSLNSLIDKFDGVVDLIDCDIQGGEKVIFQSAREKMNKFVKRVHIGTHSNEIDDILIDFFRSMKWKKINCFRCGERIDLPQGIIIFEDGIQTWINPNLEE